jgi:preprotein translocase SecE subunit
MFKKMINYLASAWTELKKVSWPGRTEMMESARIILVLMVVLALAVFAVDLVLSSALKKIL